MRAEVDRVQFRAMARQFGLKDIVNLMYRRFIKIAALDTRLVRDQNRFHAALVDSPDRLAGPGEGFIQAGIIHVSDFLGYGCVAVYDTGVVFAFDSYINCTDVYRHTTAILS